MRMRRKAAGASPGGSGAAQAAGGCDRRVLNANGWPVERVNRVLKEFAAAGWKLVAVTGHGLSGVQLWLER
jgi:hypothetical protein